MSELPHDPMDDLFRRAHSAGEGAPPEFAGRLRARMLAEGVTRRRTRMLYIQAGVAIAAVLVLALFVGMNTQWFKPAHQPAGQDSAEAIGPANTPLNEPATPDVKPEPQPEPQGNTEPTPEPIKPDDGINKPEPAPEQPEDTVEIPKQPEGTPEEAPEGTPEDTVEKPEPVKPVEPDGTEAKPATPSSQWAQVTVIGEPKLRMKVGADDWADYDGRELLVGTTLQAARGNVDLQLDGGGLARFNGEIHLESEDGAIRFVLNDDSLFVDNLETEMPVIVLGGGHTGEMANGVGVFYAARLTLEAVCLAGTLTLDDGDVAIGFSKRATARGVGDAKEFKGDRFLNNMPERLLLREDFTQAPPGGMYGDGERLEDGVAIQERQPGYIAFRYNPTLQVLPGTVLRMRIRTTAASKLELELFTDTDIKLLKRNKQQMFKHVWSPQKNGEWQVIELRLEEIPDNEDPESFPGYGTLLRNFKLHFTGKKLEIDWVEFVRVQH